jgi:uncharacterized membrane protein
MNDPIFWVNVLMRWVHVASAVAGVGGTLMMRFVVLPALDRLPNGQEILSSIHPFFKRLIHTALGLLLLTGFYNYWLAIEKIHGLKDQGLPYPHAYHMVMGTKIILSLALFGIATMLLSPSSKLAENRKQWLSVNVVLGLVIMLLAAYLRRAW